VTRETERLVEVAALIGGRLNSAVKDVIPPEAQTHLLNAQRELLTAVFLIYEHQVAGRRAAPPAPRRRASAPRKPRVQRIDIE
jgi:hypothetical protein